MSDTRAGQANIRQWLNLFEITNLADHSVPYQLLRVQGLPPDDQVDRNLNQLVKKVAYELRQPVALVHRQDIPYLAIPASVPMPTRQQRLTPHVVLLVPDIASELRLDRLNPDTLPIARAFLQRSLNNPLFEDPQLWCQGRTYFEKHPMSELRQAGIDLYSGFVWNIVANGDGRLFVSIDSTMRIVDHDWLSTKVDGRLNGYKGRSCVYHFGHQWYVVQLVALTDLNIEQQTFVTQQDAPVQNVFAYTRKRWDKDMPPWVKDLDPSSPAILYRNPGSSDQRYGALALCKRLYSTADSEAHSAHRQAILDPTTRFARADLIAATYFQHADLLGKPLRVSTSPLEIDRRVFAMPSQRFGHDRILAVDQSDAELATDRAPLDLLGKSRLRLLLDPKAGPIVSSPFDRQWLLVPDGLPRAINDDFRQRFETAMRSVSGQADYRVQVVVYNDNGARSLHQQVTAIRAAIAANKIDRGYALLVLPEQAKTDLHNYMKKTLWPNLQFQCALARKIKSYYRPTSGGEWQAIPYGDRTLSSYVRNCALGMMVVNRKWGWALATPLHYDLYIGIDVLHGLAGMTFVCDSGRQIYFQDFKCRNQERLTEAQLRSSLVSMLEQIVPQLAAPPQSIVVQRDGRIFASEIRGLEAAIGILIGHNVLTPQVVVGAVEIRKGTVDHLRLAEGSDLAHLQNPKVGSRHALTSQEGIVSTTGRPFTFPGTAKPLAAMIACGQLNIDWVLEDIFALSQLVFTAPDKCARLPISIKLADDFLEPIAGAADEEAALYETDGADDDLEHDETPDPQLFSLRAASRR